MDAEGDVRDGQLPAAAIPTFYGGEYPIFTDATGIGIWQEDNSASAVGDAHWRHRQLRFRLSSASSSRLVYAFRSSTNQCSYGFAYDGGLSSVYQYIQWMCKMTLNSAALVSAQMHVQTWGQMGAGDTVALELWRGNGAPEMTLSHNFC